MPQFTAEQKYQIGKSVTLWGIVLNLVLTVGKYFAGYFGRSQALLADATHSLGDLLTDFVTLWGIRCSRMPKDWNHPYGHGKIETIASCIVGIGLLGVGVMIGWEGILKCLNVPQTSPSLLALSMALITAVSKEALFRYTYRRGKEINSKAVLANAYDHRSDALSSLAALAGIAGAMLGWRILDPLAAVIVAGMILKTGLSVTMEAAYELAETSVPQRMLDQIKEVAMHAEGVASIGDVRARQVGCDIVMELTIVVNPDLTVREAHAIADQVELEIQGHIKDAGLITVHVEPA